MMNYNIFNISKNNFLSKFINYKNSEEDLDKINNTQEEFEENNKLLKKEINTNSISRFFFFFLEVVFY